jgi:hypothetical protein
MAKASPSVSRADTSSNPAIATAATEIHALINSKVQSLTKDDLAAIIMGRSSAYWGQPDVTYSHFVANDPFLTSIVRARCGAAIAW